MNRTIPGVWCNYNTDVIRTAEVRAKRRCPQCSRYLLLQEVRDAFGYDLLGYALPPHKTKSRKLKRPKGDRRGARARRG